MKTKILTLALIALAASAFSQSLTSLFDLAPANGSTNGASVSVSGVRLPAEILYLQTGGSGITNAIDLQTNVVSGVTNVVNTRTNVIKYTKQASLDGSNWITVDTAYPRGTNAAIWSWSPSNAIPMYTRVVVFTSNSIPVGVMKQ